MFDKVIAAAAFSSLALAAPAAGQQAQLALSGEVPTICRVAVSDLAGAAGQLTEFCNAPRGYEVFLDPAPGLDGIAIAVDGERVVLSSDRPTLISRSDTPQARARRIGFEQAAPAGLTVALRVQPRT